MRVKVTKPRGGRVDWEVDDRRGQTRFHKRGRDVLLADLEGQLSAALAEFETKRLAIRDARRGVQP